jgi:hypothetical protein
MAQSHYKHSDDGKGKGKKGKAIPVAGSKGP